MLLYPVSLEHNFESVIPSSVNFAAAEPVQKSDEQAIGSTNVRQ